MHNLFNVYFPNLVCFRLNVTLYKKQVNHKETQVEESNLSTGSSWVCQRRNVKIKQEIKQEHMEDDVNVKLEPGVGGDSFCNEPSTSQAWPSRTSPSSNSMYMQKRFELLTSERNSLKQELEKIKKEQLEQNQGPSVSQLSKELKDSRQKIEDLESQLNKATSQGNILMKQLELLRVSQNVNANEALCKSLAQLKNTQEERDMLLESKAGLERRVNQFTKTLKEKLDVQSRDIEEDFNKKLRAARERAASAEVKADNLKEEKKSTLAELTRVLQLLKEEEQKHKNTVEKGTYQALVKKQEEMDRDLKEAKEKEVKAVNALHEVKQQQRGQIKEFVEQGNKRLEQCRQELQVSQDLSTLIKTKQLDAVFKGPFCDPQPHLPFFSKKVQIFTSVEAFRCKIFS